MNHILGDGNRKSKYNPDLDKVLKKAVEDEERRKKIKAAKGKLEGKEEAEVDETQNPSAKDDSGRIYVPSENHMTYFSGLQYLQQKFVADGNIQPTINHNGNVIPVALSLEEILKARILGYRNGTTEEEKLRLFKLYFWTGDGIAYQKSTKKTPNPPFKLVKQSRDLGLLDANKTHIEKDYSTIVGTELQRDGSKYDEYLTEQEVLKHEVWSNLVSKKVLQEYVPICFKLLKDVYKRTEGMGFWLQSPEAKDTLRSVYVDSIDDDSDAIGNNYLNNNAYFLQVTQAKNFSIGSRGRK